MKTRAKKLFCVTVTVTLALCILTLFVSGANIGAGTVKVSWGNLNVRSSPTTESKIVRTLENNSYVTLVEKSNEWYKVEYADGTYGYCHENYISVISYDTASVKTDGGKLNVRSGASTSSYVIDSLDNGQEVVILTGSNGWHRVLYDGSDIGWVSSSYLRRISENDTSTVKYPSISLSVPYYSQADTQWSDVKLGSYGEDIGKIGCTVSCFAMSESFRTNSVITPATVAKNQSFTAGGALYWPSNYSRSYTSSYLSFLYEKLSDGIPVLLEAKKYNGAKHWVIVTGYKGGDTLNVSNFTINDPSLSKRSTLSEFLTDYPLYSKMAYYTY